MLAYWVRYHEKLTTALLQHLRLLGIVLAISIVIAAVLTLLISSNRRLSNAVVGLFSALYSVPSLAFFALLIPITGIGLDTAVIVLVIYNQYLLVRNFLAGLDSVDPALIEAARGMGMTPVQILLRIKLPLAFPVIMAGIHLAVISTIGIGTIASVIDAGGLGVILFDGLRTQKIVKLLWGTVLSAGLAISANALLSGIEHLARKRLHFS
ncbi:MAG: ABC transporter permease [Actinomycetes bacterium]|jgi:osmoprotectant transport system permease protein|nr:ABC transporter permease [Actinomycetes bacterium]